MSEIKDLGYCILIDDDNEIIQLSNREIDFCKSSDICDLLGCSFFNIVRSSYICSVVPQGVLVVDDMGAYKCKQNLFASLLSNYPIYGKALLFLEYDHDLHPVPEHAVFDLYEWWRTLL